MPLKLCVIGDSHIAALKAGEEIAADPRLTVTYFGSPRGKLELVQDGTSLFPVAEGIRRNIQYTSGGLDRILVKDYDAYVLAGLQFGFHQLLTFALEYGTLAHAKDFRSPHVLSQALYRSALTSLFEDCAAIKILKLLRTLSEAPVLLYPTPYPSERLLREAPYSALPATDRYLKILQDDFSTIAQTVLSNASCDVHWQEDETLSRPGLTDPKWFMDGVKLMRMHEPTAERGRADNLHIGKALGKKHYDRIVAWALAAP